MRRQAASLAALGAGVGVALAVLAVLFSLPRGRLLDVYVLFVGGLVLLALVRATQAAGANGEGSLYERALRRRRFGVERPAELERLEREVVLAGGNAFDVHVRIRPSLREIAAHRLESGRALELDRGAPETRALLGADLWELVRPDRPAPNDRSAPGLTLERLRAYVDRLERL